MGEDEDDQLDALINRIEGSKPNVKTTRENATYYLDVQLRTQFEVYCRSKGERPAQVLEHLMRIFLKRLPAKKGRKPPHE